MQEDADEIERHGSLLEEILSNYLQWNRLVLSEHKPRQATSHVRHARAAKFKLR
jgi:hypothetical protein